MDSLVRGIGAGVAQGEPVDEEGEHGGGILRMEEPGAGGPSVIRVRRVDEDESSRAVERDAIVMLGRGGQASAGAGSLGWCPGARWPGEEYESQVVLLVRCANRAGI